MQKPYLVPIVSVIFCSGCFSDAEPVDPSQLFVGENFAIGEVVYSAADPNCICDDLSIHGSCEFDFDIGVVPATQAGRDLLSGSKVTIDVVINNDVLETVEANGTTNSLVFTWITPTPDVLRNYYTDRANLPVIEFQINLPGPDENKVQVPFSAPTSSGKAIDCVWFEGENGPILKPIEGQYTNIRVGETPPDKIVVKLFEPIESPETLTLDLYEYDGLLAPDDSMYFGSYDQESADGLKYSFSVSIPENNGVNDCEYVADLFFNSGPIAVTAHPEGRSSDFDAATANEIDGRRIVWGGKCEE